MKDFITFLHIIQNLKHIPRYGSLLFSGIKTGNIQEHSFMVTFISASLIDHFRHEGKIINGEKVLKVAISHDAGESVLGDIPTSSPSYQSFFDEDLRTIFKTAEKKALSELLSLAENRAPFSKEEDLTKEEKDLLDISDIIAMCMEILHMKFDYPRYEWVDSFWKNTIKRLKSFSGYEFIPELARNFQDAFLHGKKPANPLLTKKRFNG